ncbi:MAG TPA: YbaK/EbsC family protein [Clostridia bacterium]|jgi:Cys-tRNA(Pro) deacylase|nr:YbaK/EbsC family protein [Clostridia bacterium]
MSFKRVYTYLKNFDPSLEPLLFEEKMPTAQEAALKLNVQLGQIAKSILFNCDGKYGLFVVAGDGKVNNKKAKLLLGGKKIKMASPEEVKEVTGFDVGGVCPFALAQEIPIFLDQSLKRFDCVYTAAGVAEPLLGITFEQLEEVTGGRVVDL